MKALARGIGMTEGQTYTIAIGLAIALVTVLLGIPPTLRERIAQPLASARTPVQSDRDPVDAPRRSTTAPEIAAPSLQGSAPGFTTFDGPFASPGTSDASGPAASDRASGAAGLPVRQGWWSAFNPTAPGLPLPPSAPRSPAAPDVPANGLYVAGGAEEPQAYSALAFLLPRGQRKATLSLKVAPDSLSTPDAKVLACAVEPDDRDFTAAEGGERAAGPGYDCAQPIEGEVAEGGDSYTFDVSALIDGSELVVAIVSGAASDRVVFAPPADDSLVST